VAGIQKRKGREFGCGTACRGEGRRGMPARMNCTVCVSWAPGIPSLSVACHTC